MRNTISAVAVSFSLFVANSAFAQGMVCDVDVDGDVDSNDIALILAARNTPANGPDDPRDADGDGFITVLDARQCALACTLPGCAEPQANEAPAITAVKHPSIGAGSLIAELPAATLAPAIACYSCLAVISAFEQF